MKRLAFLATVARQGRPTYRRIAAGWSATPDVSNAPAAAISAKKRRPINNPRTATDSASTWATVHAPTKLFHMRLEPLIITAKPAPFP